jgi:uncharacterized protein YdhG (YjbR/CyaY superfamily)
MTAKTVAEYIKALPPAQRKALTALRATIKAVAPDATEKIAWRVPYYNQDGMLISFAAFKDHCTLLPMNPDVIEIFKKELAPYRKGKVALHFTPEKPIPASLVRKIVKAGIALNKENKSRKATRKKP